MHCLFQFSLHCGQFVFAFRQALLALLGFLFSPPQRALQRPDGRKALPVCLGCIAQLFSLGSYLRKQLISLSIEPKDQHCSGTNQKHESSNARHFHL